MRFEPFAASEADWARRMDELRFRYGKWDLNVAGKPTIPKGALVLDQDELRGLAAVAEDFYAASLTAQGAWASPEARTRGQAPSLPPDVEAVAAMGAPGPFVTRVDLFPTRSGWMASECNDDVPGGYNEAIGLPMACWDLIPEGLDVPGDLPDALLRLVQGSSGAGNGGSGDAMRRGNGQAALRLGITYATGYAEDLEVVNLLAAWFGSQGIRCVLGAPSLLAHGPEGTLLAGEPVDAVFRFFPVEWHAELSTESRAAWDRAMAAGLRVANPFATGRTQDKASFACLRPQGAASSAVPRTRLFGPEAFSDAVADPARWVLKPRFGRMGGGVVRGADCDRATWRKRLDEALRRRGGADFVLQERFDPLPVELAPGTARTPCVGAYVVDGKFAGCYTRLADGPVVAYDAANVLTLVEGP